MIKGKSNIAIENMSLDEMANHMLEVLGFVERYANNELIEAALIDAGYVIEQFRIFYGKGVRNE